jgi:hypothetical protein
MRLCTAFIALFLFSTAIARADDDIYSRVSLRGLESIQVVVEELQPEVEQNGLTAIAVRTDVELKLRQAGIRVLDTTAAIWLHVSVSVLTSKDGIWPFMIQVELSQPVALARDPSILMASIYTWSVSGFGKVGRLNVRSLRDDVRDQVDKFINAYLAANPKK